VFPSVSVALTLAPCSRSSVALISSLASIAAEDFATSALQTTLNTYYADTVETRVQTPTKTKAINVQIGPGDVISNIPVMIDYEHHQIHEGETHSYSYLIGSLASSSNQDFRLNFGNNFPVKISDGLKI
jgi:hypothetical protein